MRSNWKYCKHCKKAFYGQYNKLYCSDKCRKKAHYRSKKPLEFKTCVKCGTEFKPRHNNQTRCVKCSRYIIF
ncbi:MAG: hypothetical protein HZC47_00990 [Methanobacterium sp.]|nr:hypothetical protein [Methanobacterium sp.]